MNSGLYPDRGIRKSKISEEVAEYMKKAILNGHFRQGEQLPSVRDLSEQFRVGQSTVREALSMLKTMGMIETRQGEGTFVKAFDADVLARGMYKVSILTRRDLIHLFDVRKIVEKGSAQLAAHHRTEEDLLKLASAIDRMEEELKRGLHEDEGDWIFHLTVAEATHNEILIQLMKKMEDMMREALRESHRRLYRQAGRAAQLFREHQGIYEAIASGDEMKAEERMLRHIVGVEADLLKREEEESRARAGNNDARVKK